MLSVPTDHAYVRSIAPVPGRPTPQPTVVRLRDPQDPWWPPPALDPGWLAGRTDDFDLCHVHFGFDARSTGDLEAFVRVLRDAGRPLVYTVHDLRNPHHPTRELHDAQLDVLVPAAAALITLTQGAADEIRRRWGREATVLPHPHVVDLPTLVARERNRATRPPEQPFTVGLHLKSLRPCMSGAPVVRALLDAVAEVAELRDVLLRVDAHRDVVEPDGARHDAALVVALAAAARQGAQVEVHDYFTDDELWDYLTSLDVSVLPYRYGTHSGWLEACRDLGTAVVAPDCGYYADQGPVQTFYLDEDGLDAASLQRALVSARRAGPQPPVSVETRAQQRQRIASAHAAIYAAVLA